MTGATTVASDQATAADQGSEHQQRSRAVSSPGCSAGSTANLPLQQ
jgi:hypothetical protein